MAKKQKNKELKAAKVKIEKITKYTLNKAGAWAFILGIVLAMFAGFWQLTPLMISSLIVLGLIVGFLNIELRQTNNFLFTTLVLVLISSLGGSLLGQVAVIGSTLSSIFSAIVTFLIPAAIIVALKSIYQHAKEEA